MKIRKAVLFMVILIVLSLTACGSKSKQETVKTEETLEEKITGIIDVIGEADHVAITGATMEIIYSTNIETKESIVMANNNLAEKVFAEEGVDTLYITVAATKINNVGDVEYTRTDTGYEVSKELEWDI